MTVQKDHVVSIDYELKNASGEILDSSAGGEPLVYLHGNQNIIPGLEKELEGKKVNDNIKCVIPAAEAYGERDDELVFAVPRSEFADSESIQPGMQFQAHQEDGVHIVTVVSISDTEVTVDANHPLAGMPLHFDVTVKEVRAATAEELTHGHVHAEGGCGDCGCGGECGDDCECGDDDEECGSGGCGCGCN
ncbi:MAG: peptidylprolyl isomerase [Spirochaetes bacterium]|nr:peptidylprolyl isomerase [Spirochaetota bacterium]MBU0956535.1 peptidylprolyl isomerase [Spirochaetota bacterium]